VDRPTVEAADEAVKEECMQIARELRELGIGWIAAHSPQVKGASNASSAPPRTGR
jgi:hypothetical protein